MAWDEANAWMSGRLSEKLYQNLLDDATTAPVPSRDRSSGSTAAPAMWC